MGTVRQDYYWMASLVEDVGSDLDVSAFRQMCDELETLRALVAQYEQQVGINPMTVQDMIDKLNMYPGDVINITDIRWVREMLKSKLAKHGQN